MKRHPTHQQALELCLHDSLDRLEAFTLELAFNTRGMNFEILDIHPPLPDVIATPQPRAAESEAVVSLQQARRRRRA